jgi:hypothetical protein
MHVYVFIFEHRHGRDVSAHASEGLAVTEAARIAREWWGEARERDRSLPSKPPAADAEAFELYASAQDGVEFLEITGCVVEGLDLAADGAGAAGPPRAKKWRTEMDEFRLSAYPRYADGSSGDTFAAVLAPSLVACFGAMAADIARWLPEALTRCEGQEPPEEIELTLEWSGAPAQSSMPDSPKSPGGPAQHNGSPRSRSHRCSVRRRLGCVEALALPLGSSKRERPCGTRT